MKSQSVQSQTYPTEDDRKGFLEHPTFEGDQRYQFLNCMLLISSFHPLGLVIHTSSDSTTLFR